MPSTLRYILIALLLLTPGMAHAQLYVQSGLTADTLVQRLLGSGVNYSNAVVKCNFQGQGIFAVYSSNLGLDSGIILSTGMVEGFNSGSSTAGMNDPASFNASSSFTTGATLSDPDLNTILAPTGTSSFDACVLEFDFVPLGDTISFNYVFASEEYSEYSCSQFNDIFAFFLSGPGYPTTTNIARIPGTNIPVAVNSTTDTILNGNGPDCTNMGPGSPFSQYYVNNLNGTSVVYNGLTTVLTAEAVVQPCSTYHIKLAIGDASDPVLDSGVFLEASSFTSNAVKVDMTYTSLVPNNNDALMEGCLDGLVTVKVLPVTDVPQVLHLSYSGSATRGIDFSAPDDVTIAAFDSLVSFVITGVADNDEEGIESILISGTTTTGCNGIASADIDIPVVEQPGFTLLSIDTGTCDGAFTVELQAQGDVGVTFHWTSSPPSTIADPNAANTPGTATGTTVYTANAFFGTCPIGSESFIVQFGQGPWLAIIPNDTIVCLQDSMQIKAYVSPPGNYTYQWSPVINLGDPTAFQPLFFSNILRDHTYHLTVTTSGGCVSHDSVVIHTYPPPTLYNVTVDTTIRYAGAVQLNAAGAYTYTWIPGEGLSDRNIPDPLATITLPSTYMVIGIDTLGCRDSATVHLDIDYTVNDFVPSIFTPNGDGKNDVFRILGVYFQAIESFRIYNRFGEVVFDTKDINKGWDGTFKGKLADVGVYHYLIRLNLPNGTPKATKKMLKGDVTLMR